MLQMLGWFMAWWMGQKMRVQRRQVDRWDIEGEKSLGLCSSQR